MPQTLPDLRAARGVLFDLDGVLTPTAEVHMRAWQTVFDEVFDQWGITPAYTEEDYFAHVDGKKRYDGVASVMRSRDIEVPWGETDDAPDAETICGIGNRKNAAFAAELTANGVAPFPGSLAVVERLHAEGIPLAVVSSSKNAPAVLGAAGLDQYFTAIIDGLVAERDHLASKPAPDMFIAGARALGHEPEECIAVEDAVAGVASAAAAGCAAVIGVDRGAGAEVLEAAGAHCVVDDLAVFVPELDRDLKSENA